MGRLFWAAQWPLSFEVDPENTRGQNAWKPDPYQAPDAQSGLNGLQGKV
jgi:hypothetical protein